MNGKRLQYKILLTYIPLLVFPLLGQSQSRSKLLQKAWIRTRIESLSPTPKAPNTTYLRYTFDRQNVTLSRNVAWNGAPVQWSFNDPVLTIWKSNYIVEELTDTSLVFYEPDRDRYYFVSETAYSAGQQPDTTERFNDRTVYIASRYLAPRYKKEKSPYNVIFDRLYEVYPVKHETTFLAKFVVTEQGRIERINIVSGIAEEHSNEFIKQIQKTSGDWNPAKIGGMPVCCEITFEIKYQDALNPRGGTLSGEIR